MDLHDIIASYIIEPNKNIPIIRKGVYSYIRESDINKYRNITNISDEQMSLLGFARSRNLNPDKIKIISNDLKENYILDTLNYMEMINESDLVLTEAPVQDINSFGMTLSLGINKVFKSISDKNYEEEKDIDNAIEKCNKALENIKKERKEVEHKTEIQAKHVIMNSIAIITIVASICTGFGSGNAGTILKIVTGGSIPKVTNMIFNSVNYSGILDKYESHIKATIRMLEMKKSELKKNKEKEKDK